MAVTKARTGGHVVVESLESLGAEVAFGLPGIHALGIWEALRTSELRTIALRTELSAGFAADGYARVSGRPVPLLLSTGPGALISLASLMEAATSHVPVVAIASQIPSGLVGRGRGYLTSCPTSSRRSRRSSSGLAAQRAPGSSRSCSPKPGAWPPRRRAARCSSRCPSTS
jgi:acetolactate synthase-1/2/3 large subunit